MVNILKLYCFEKPYYCEFETYIKRILKKDPEFQLLPHHTEFFTYNIVNLITIIANAKLMCDDGNTTFLNRDR